jgi:hypothetical protein
VHGLSDPKVAEQLARATPIPGYCIAKGLGGKAGFDRQGTRSGQRQALSRGSPNAVYYCYMEPAMVRLTPEQSQTLHSQAEPLILDPTTQKVYVAVSSEVYDRIKDLLEDQDEQVSWQRLSDRARTALVEENPPAA